MLVIIMTQRNSKESVVCLSFTENKNFFEEIAIKYIRSDQRRTQSSKNIYKFIRSNINENLIRNLTQVGQYMYEFGFLW